MYWQTLPRNNRAGLLVRVVLRGSSPRRRQTRGSASIPHTSQRGRSAGLSMSAPPGNMKLLLRVSQTQSYFFIVTYLT